MKYDTIPSLKRGALDKIVKEFSKIADELMFGSSKTDTDMTCEGKHEKNETIRKNQDS